MNQHRSLKTEILLRLVMPLIFFVSVDAVLSYFVTLHYVDQAYDRWLLDSARSLAQEIKVRDGRVVVELPPAALEIFNWDDEDKTYFKIISSEREILAGDRQVPEPLAIETDWTQPVYFDDTLYLEPVRIVSMQVELQGAGEKIFIHVAETLNKRRTMMTDILLADVIPQLLLVVAAGVSLLSGLRRGLKPLRTLARHIAARSARDLSPIPEHHVFAEVRALTDTINALLQQLTNAISTQQRFVANAAHQLRTPLAGLKLQAERALRSQQLDELQPALVQIQNCADRMTHLTSQLLVLAQSEPVNGSHEPQPVDLCALCRSVCIDWVPKALQRGMDLSFEGPDAAIVVNGNAVLLRELLINLLDNAIDYGYPHGNITVSIGAAPRPLLTVCDDGPGIPETEMANVFERFYRIPGSPGNGCGLGLAIVKDIAELHGAQFKLRRAGEKGGLCVALTFGRIDAEKPALPVDANGG